MRLLIKILIISDDIEKWASYFKGYHIITTRDNMTIQNDWFFIRFRSRLVENIRGEKYDKIVVDKFVSDDYIYTVLGPMTSVPKIIYTEDGYKLERRRMNESYKF